MRIGLNKSKTIIGFLLLLANLVLSGCQDNSTNIPTVGITPFYTVAEAVSVITVVPPTKRPTATIAVPTSTIIASTVTATTIASTAVPTIASTNTPLPATTTVLPTIRINPTSTSTSIISVKTTTTIAATTLPTLATTVPITTSVPVLTTLASTTIGGNVATKVSSTPTIAPTTSSVPITISEGDLPVYPGAKRVNSTPPTAGTDISIYYLSPAKTQDIVTWATKAFADKGWSGLAEVDSNGASYVTGSLGKNNLVITVLGAEAHANPTYDSIFKLAGAGPNDSVIYVVVVG